MSFQQLEITLHVAQVTHNYYEIVRKRRAAAILILIIQLDKKKKYLEKKHKAASVKKKKRIHRMFDANLPKFILEDLRFHNYIRMSAVQLENLLTIVGPDIFRQTLIKEPVAIAKRLLLTLKYLASGDSITSMAYQYLVDETTATNIISETCEAIWNNLLSKVMRTELSHENWYKISKYYESKWNFPHCIGAIDGKHVVIQSPDNQVTSSYNYKDNHIVLIAVCDGHYLFSFIDIGVYGRRSDGDIFKESAICQKFENSQMNLPSVKLTDETCDNLPYCLVGDEAFPLKTYLLRPYPEKKSTSHDKRVFNYRLGRARKTIEITFGVLASSWRIFSQPINMDQENAMKIIQACVCLHNWLRLADLNEKGNFKYVTSELVNQNEKDEDENDQISGSWRPMLENSYAFTNITRTGTNSSTKGAANVREKFLQYFNDEGALDWQDNYI